MKKISSIILSILCLVVLFVSGCTYADNATLLVIQQKYEAISNKNTELFNGAEFSINYNSCPNLKALTVDDRYELYYNLKTDSLNDYLGKEVYAVLMHAVNSTKLTNNALSIISNNNKTEKKYKKNMYTALVNLQNDAKNLTNSKKALESVFETDESDAEVISKEFLTEYRFNKYIKSLNSCLNDLLVFNRNYNEALLNNLSQDVTLEELLYSNNTHYQLTKDNFNKLINTSNIVLSNYILSYSADIVENAGEDKEMVSSLRNLVQLQISLQDVVVEDIYKVNDYKVLKTMENSLLINEKVFNNIIKEVKSIDDLSLEKNSDKVDFIQSYRASLLNYANKIIDFINSL